MRCFSVPRTIHIYRAFALMLLLLSTMADRASTAEISFRREVMAVLSKAGCNMGACHGNQNGKGGFRLSLRGQDPEFDFASLTRDLSGRRIDLLEPDKSLMLLKPTGQLAHQGGVRIRPDSLEYDILRNWIVQGATHGKIDEPSLANLQVFPDEQVLVGETNNKIQLQVTATDSCGTAQDVTRLATYETSDLAVTVNNEGCVERRAFAESTVVVRYLDQQRAVRLAFVPDRTEFQWQAPAANNYVDHWVDRKLEQLRVNPSALADDHVFVRRAFLDAVGILPTADEARAFVTDQRPNKRAALIDSLLARPEFAELWALKWSDVLRNEEKVLDSQGVEVFHRWIRNCMADGKPIDQFVRELVRATGSTYENPPANFYRANRDPSTRAETTARLFLGVRLQCAKCHNHPFDRWTQDDYYSWSAIFSRIDYDIIKNERRDKLDKNEFNGEQIVKIADRGGVDHPRTGHYVSAKLLGDRELGPGSYQDRLTPLAVWLTSPENTAFARAQVNFIWYHLMGRGLVEPIDDVRVTNPASNASLLDALAKEFISSGFDLRSIVRTIMASRTYQLSAMPNETNRDDVVNFSRAVVQRLPAEKLLDAQSQVLDSPAEFSGYPRGTRAGQLAGVRRARSRERGSGSGDRFLKVFGKPERLLACECERSNETALAQAFSLIGSDVLQARINHPENRLAQLAGSDLSDKQVVEELYWTALCRPPSNEELAAGVSLLEQPLPNSSAPTQFAVIFFVPIELPNATERLVAIQDLAWALINAKEFVFRN
jgi:hypothetical protein